MIIEVNSVLLLVKTACLGKIPFSRYGAKGVCPTPLRLRFFFEKKIFRFFFLIFFFDHLVSFNSGYSPEFLMQSHTPPPVIPRLRFFRFFPIFYSICFNSIFLIYVFCIFCWSILSVLWCRNCWSMLSVLWCRNCVETSPTRTLQFSTQLSYEAKNSPCVCPSVRDAKVRENRSLVFFDFLHSDRQQ